MSGTMEHQARAKGVTMRLSLTPFLVAIELGFVFALAWRCARPSPMRRTMRPVYVYLSWLTVVAIAIQT